MKFWDNSQKKKWWVIRDAKLPSGYLTQPWYRWPIEIDDFPIKTPPFMVGIFHGELLNNQRVWIVEIWWHMHPFSCWYYMILPPISEFEGKSSTTTPRTIRVFVSFDFDQLFGHWTSNIWMQPAWTPCNLCRIWVDLLLKVGNIVWSHVVLVQASSTKNTRKI